MKKSELEAGGVYGFNSVWRSPVLLLTTQLVAERHESRGPTTYELADAGAKVRQAKPGWSGTYTHVGYLVVIGPGEELESLDAAAALKEVLETGKLTGHRIEMCFSLAQLKGPWHAIVAARDNEERQRRERNAEKTREYNEAVLALNPYLDAAILVKPSGYTWGHHTPRVELTPKQVAEIVANARDAAVEAYGRGSDQALKAVDARIEAGELIETGHYVDLPDA